MDTLRPDTEQNGDKIDSCRDAAHVMNAGPDAGYPCGKRSPRARYWFNPNTKKVLGAACMGLLVCWCIWWCVSFFYQDLQGCRHLWFPPAFGVDFYRHVDYPARTWWNGGDPYADKDIIFPYPPSELRLFAWVNLMTSRAALMVWLVVMAAIIAAAAWMASRWRRRLSLGEITPLAAIVLILFSTPVLFAMERGQYDPLSLLFIISALPLLQRSSKWSQFLAGAVLCLAPWVKVYPGLMFVGLIGLRRWRALAGFVVFGLALIAVLNIDELRRFLVANARHIQMAENMALFASGDPCPWNHPLSLMGLWFGVQPGWLGLLLGKVMAAVLLLPPLIWVTYHVYRCPERDTLIYPYLLWIVALATFVPPVSNDYNLCFLPLAVLAVWDRHDPLPVQVLLALLFLWWQPIGQPITGKPLLLIKLLGLYAVAVCLVMRAHEQSRLVAVNAEGGGGYCKNHL